MTIHAPHVISCESCRCERECDGRCEVCPVCGASTAREPENWRLYRDRPAPAVCAHCGQPTPEAYAILADGRRFCAAACYESWVRR